MYDKPAAASDCLQTDVVAVSSALPTQGNHDVPGRGPGQTSMDLDEAFEIRIPSMPATGGAGAPGTKSAAGPAPRSSSAFSSSIDPPSGKQSVPPEGHAFGVPPLSRGLSRSRSAFNRKPRSRTGSVAAAAARLTIGDGDAFDDAWAGRDSSVALGRTTSTGGESIRTTERGDTYLNDGRVPPVMDG